MVKVSRVSRAECFPGFCRRPAQSPASFLSSFPFPSSFPSSSPRGDDTPASPFLSFTHFIATTFVVVAVPDNNT